MKNRGLSRPFLKQQPPKKKKSLGSFTCQWVKMKPGLTQNKPLAASEGEAGRGRSPWLKLKQCLLGGGGWDGVGDEGLVVSGVVQGIS